MLSKIGKLNRKLLLAILLVGGPVFIADLWFSARETRSVAMHEIDRWTFIVGESVRVSMNTLMREDRMSARFAMFNDLKTEIPGLADVSIVRGPRVDELIMAAREQKDIPREHKAIEDYRQEIADLEAELADTRDRAARADLQEEIGELKAMIAQSEKQIAKLRHIEVDDRERPRDDLQRAVLRTGEKLSRMEGDMMRVIAPYKVRPQGCTEGSGCHTGAKEGDVLGAIDLRFSVAAVNQEIRNNMVLMGVARFVIGLLVFAMIMMVINYVVINNIHKMLAALRKMSEGDLTVSLPTKGDDEIQDLSKGFNAFAAVFRSMMGRMMNNAASMASASEQMNVTANDIRSGAESQNGQAQSVSNAAVEMSSSSRNVAHITVEMAESAREASTVARHGEDVVNESIAGMHNIAEVSRQSGEVVKRLVDRTKGISDVLALIDNIAKQTNLLALNAAIEAARAGEQGRGFSVVADEVRHLAAQTADATKNVAEMVHGIQNDASQALVSIENEILAVGQGSQQASKVRESLSQILMHVQQFGTLIDQVSASAEQQSVTSDHIAEEINVVAQVTEQSLDNASQIVRASQEVAAMAAQLSDEVQKFRI